MYSLQYYTTLKTNALTKKFEPPNLIYSIYDKNTNTVEIDPNLYSHLLPFGPVVIAGNLHFTTPEDDMIPMGDLRYKVYDYANMSEQERRMLKRKAESSNPFSNYATLSFACKRPHTTNAFEEDSCKYDIYTILQDENNANLREDEIDVNMLANIILNTDVVNQIQYSLSNPAFVSEIQSLNIDELTKNGILNLPRYIQDQILILSEATRSNLYTHYNSIIINNRANPGANVCVPNNDPQIIAQPFMTIAEERQGFQQQQQQQQQEVSANNFDFQSVTSSVAQLGPDSDVNPTPSTSSDAQYLTNVMSTDEFNSIINN